jgi:hypothetical protein
MPPRDEDLARTGVGSVTVHLKDIEPFAGLVAVCARFNTHLTPAAYDAMTDGATMALNQMQAILWRLEHSSPEPDPPSEPNEQG